ncbi:MAG: threonine synthase [Rhodospirillales bacterium]|nr:MAG: threonine synthase [Rhodospirillales bacterium]
MRYISTRGEAPILEFDEVLLAGLAADGGLYVPESWPRFDADDFRALRGLSYAETATRVMAPFIGGRIEQPVFERLVRDAYDSFDHPAVTPLRQLDANLWLLELFHGPTLAFKDLALQFLGRLFDHVLTRRGERVTIVGATSGDTGSAAIEACRDREAIEIFILHPHGRVSEVQRRQMTTVTARNVHNIAIKGSFDDCQDLVKAMFADRGFRDELRLSAVNSINWARIMAQIVYYVQAAVALGAPDRPVGFAVPTGNFGNVYAGYAARQMGLPIAQLTIGSNRNDILTRFMETGVMEMRAVEPSLSPSMDIQVSSNFERLLFDVCDREGRAVMDTMVAFRRTGKLEVPQGGMKTIRALFDGYRMDDAQTLDAIAAEHRAHGQLLDPHTVIGVGAARARHRYPATPAVALATAHPAKFPDAVERAAGIRPALPPRLAELMHREERYAVLPNDIGAVKAHVRSGATTERMQ